MLILKEKTNLSNLQFLIVGDDFDPLLIGRYAVVSLENGRCFICKIWQRSFLHKGFCVMDPTVELLTDTSLPICAGQNVDSQILNKDNVKVQNVDFIKNISISVVFKDPWKRLKWDDKETALIDSLREILKLFIVTSNAVIYLNALEEFDLLGIHFIHILSTGERFGRVVKTTKFRVESKMSLWTYDQLFRNQIENHIFYQEAYDELKRSLIYRSNIRKKHNSFSENEVQDIPFFLQILMIGAGGCGKSTLVSKVCYDFGSTILPIDLSEMFTLNNEKRQVYFKSKLKLAKVLCHESNSGLCVILIKRIENIKSKSGKSLEFLNSFLEEVSHERNVLVVATTDSPTSLDPSLRSASRFSIEIFLNMHSEDQRCSIIKKLFSSFELNDKDCFYLAQNTPGFVLSDLVLVVKRSSMIINSKIVTDKVDVLNIIKSCIKNVQPSSTKGIIGLVPQSEFNLTKLGGLDDVKNKLIQVIVWPILNMDSFKRMNIPSPSGCLLYGPPGCAKTSLVRAVASSCKTTFLSVSAADLYSPFVGDAEKTITQLFQRARASAPTVLFIDEIDALVGSRTFREKGVQERILSSFLTELDGVGFKKDSEHSLSEKFNPVVIIIAATNRPQIVDSALLRPGRFDKLIYVPPPNKDERLNILEKITGNLSIDSGVSLSDIAERTQNYSGADLVNLCREAGLQAVTVCGVDVKSISQDHFDHVLNTIKPSLNNDQIKWYDDFTFG